MGGIVLELQHEALVQNSDILSLLRKSYLIARKLHLTDFQQWVNKELNGYDSGDKVLKYRHLKGEVKAWNPYHGWTPVIFNYQSGFNIHVAREAIASLIDVYNKSEGHIAEVSFSDRVNAILNRNGNVPFETKFALHISVNQIFNIMESVRTTILEWSITLEENGIIGEEMQFSEKRTRNCGKYTNYQQLYDQLFC